MQQLRWEQNRICWYPCPKWEMELTIADSSAGVMWEINAWFRQMSSHTIGSLSRQSRVEFIIRSNRGTEHGIVSLSLYNQIACRNSRVEIIEPTSGPRSNHWNLSTMMLRALSTSTTVQPSGHRSNFGISLIYLGDSIRNSLLDKAMAEDIQLTAEIQDKAGQVKS